MSEAYYNTERGRLYKGDCLEVIPAEFPDNYFDTVITDPPYFLTNESGSGFMSKGWDSLSDLKEGLWKSSSFVKDAERFFIGMQAGNGMGELNIVQENVNIKESKEGKIGDARYAKNPLKFLDALKNDFAQVFVLTKPEVLDLLKDILPSHIISQGKFLNGVKNDAKFVIPLTLLVREIKNIAPKNVIILPKVEHSGEKRIDFTLMDGLEISLAIEGMIGTKSERKYMNEIIGLVKNVERNVRERRFNATILYPINKAEIITWITSLLCVINATQKSKTVPNYLIETFYQTAFKEALRVAKPGAFLLAFGGTRTHHRLMCAIEDTGWEIRDCLMWLYGSGFPKSLDISKAIDKMKGAERKKGFKPIAYPDSECWGIPNKNKPLKDTMFQNGSRKMQDGMVEMSYPATPEAQTWDGYGTALKPAWEPIIVAMKPLDGTFAENALKYGVAGLAIDKARVKTSDILSIGSNRRDSGNINFGMKDNKEAQKQHPQGRWPTNLILSHLPECRQVGVKKVKGSGTSKQFHEGYEGESNTGFVRGVSHLGNQHGDPDGTETVEAWECTEECPVKQLDLQAGTLKSGLMKGGTKRSTGGGYHGNFPQIANLKDTYADSGSASRFFYCAKSSRSEREKGLKGHVPCVKCGGIDTDYHLDEKGRKVKCIRNDHPTVKSLAIMDYLCKLTMTPDGGIVLDPFAGSGTTLMACEKLGRNWVGIEQLEENCRIAKYRIESVKEKQGKLF